MGSSRACPTGDNLNVAISPHLEEAFQGFNTPMGPAN